MDRVKDWPPYSPGSANAWLLLVSTKAPIWRDPLLTWPTGGPALGNPHEGFFYPDPLGFWSEVRRWVSVIFGVAAPPMSLADALSVSALIHSGEDASRSRWAADRCQPHVTLFLDEASRVLAGIEPPETQVSIPDPHRPGTAYEGWWGVDTHGRVIGKAPQHPASHNFYRGADMTVFLRSIPTTPFN